MQIDRPTNYKFNVLDLIASAPQGENQLLTGKLTLCKLIEEGLLITAEDGYKLSEKNNEIAKNLELSKST